MPTRSLTHDELVALETVLLGRAFDLAERFPVLDTRIDRAFEIARAGLVDYGEADDTYTVASSSVEGHAYQVVKETAYHWTCGCPDTQRAFAGLCKHVLAVMLLTGQSPPKEGEPVP